MLSISKSFKLTEGFFFLEKNEMNNNFLVAIRDFLKVYPDSILVGAFAIRLGDYVRPVEEPRSTSDVDFVLESNDFVEFVLSNQEIPDKLKDNFITSKRHQFEHKNGVGIDILSHVMKSDFQMNRELLNFMMENLDKCSNIVTKYQITLRIAKPEFIIGSKLRYIIGNPKGIRKKDYEADCERVLRYLLSENKMENKDLVFIYLWPVEKDLWNEMEETARIQIQAD